MIVPRVPKRVVVIGDLHTDLTVFEFILRKRNLIDSAGVWCGKDAWVVCMGDIFDGRRPEIAACPKYTEQALERRLVEYILELDVMASAVGGRVLSIMGNHDACAHMALSGPYSKASDVASYARAGTERSAELKPGGGLITDLSKRWPMILVLGRFLFVHGSLEPRLLSRTDGTGLDKINVLNQDLVSFLHGTDEASWTEHGYNPLFSRYFAYESRSRHADLRKTFALLGNSVNTMFLGHTVSPTIRGLFGNRVICTDVGLSRAFGDSPVEVVEIREGVIYRLRLKRTRNSDT